MLTPEQLQQTLQGLGASTPGQGTGAKTTSLDELKASAQASQDSATPKDGGPLTKPGAGITNSPLANFFKGLESKYKGAIETASTGVKQGSQLVNEGSTQMNENGDVLKPGSSIGKFAGGVGKVARGTAQALEGVGNAGMSAVFAPVSQAFEAVTPKTGNKFADSAVQGAEFGAAHSGPTGALVGGGVGLAVEGINALMQELKNHPTTAKFLADNPDIESHVQGLVNLGLASLGGKNPTEGGANPLDMTPGEGMKQVGKNLLETARTAGSPLAEGGVIQKGAQDLKGAASQGVENLYNAVTGKGTPKDVDKFILDNYQKAVRPSVAGQSTQGQVEQRSNNVIGAVKSIVENKGALLLQDANGEVSTGRSPRTLQETTQAIDQTKDAIFKQYDSMAKAAGVAGAKVELSPIAQELNVFASDPVVQDTHPEIASYAAKRAESLNDRGSYTPDQAQQSIKLYNKSLEAFYKNPSYENASKASVDAMIVNKMRAGLDSAIESAPGLEDNKGYQELKSKYGQLKSIEKDVIHRAIVDGRKNAKGLLDFTDIASGAELVKGLATMNPGSFAASAAIKGLAKYYKYLNDPNTSIERMFSGVEKAQSAQPPKELGAPTPKTGGTGEFGTIYKGIKGQDAVNFLLEKKDGEISAALHHPDIGNIDIIWGKEGKKGYGLAHIQSQHPESLDSIEKTIQNSSVYRRTENRVYLVENHGTIKTLIRLEWDGKSKKWLLTQYDPGK